MMMAEKLNSMVVKETEALNKLLKVLEEQHELLLKNDIFGLEAIVSKIQHINKEVAELEVERRKLTAGQSMSLVVLNLKDETLDKNYRTIKRLLADIEVQKETNDMLIKQGLGFSTRMLNILSPDRKAKTYNAYGKMKR
ncbi:flagellar protein FlgN [Clostridium thermarum]|uniref:flagellar protein FlgN n=1 Tax=Clostridium thermarum TaxID=1716543 RepID=UPI001FA9ECE3|nr:flagellar protein FlgN [Clostridium thermarum]